MFYWSVTSNADIDIAAYVNTLWCLESMHYIIIDILFGVATSGIN